MIERMQKGLFAQLVVVPLFTEHRILTPGRRPQHGGREGAAAARPLATTDVEEFADALRATIRDAQRMPTSLTKFALSAASAGLSRR